MSNNIPFPGTEIPTAKFLRTTDNQGVHVPHLLVDSLPAEGIDAFGRLRTSDPGYRFDSQFTYTLDADLWDSNAGISGTGSTTHDSTNRLVTLSAAAGIPNNSIILQSHYHAPYTPGRGQLAFITFVMGATPAAGGERAAGLSDGLNGVELVQDSTGIKLVVHSTTGNGTHDVDQEDWNIDPMLGTGPSRITLNMENTQILAIQLQALYVGAVVVGFDVDGKLWPVHAFRHANNIALPYIAQANLPIRYRTTADNTGSAITMRAICASVISEGGADLENIPGRPFVATGSVTDASPKVAAVVIRAKAQLASINQNVLCVPTNVDVTGATAACWVEVRRNPTITGGTPVAVDPASCMEYLTSPVVTPDTGRLIDKFYIPASAQSRPALSSGVLGKLLLSYSHLLGVGDSLAVIIDGGNTTEAQVSVKWKEIR